VAGNSEVAHFKLETEISGLMCSFDKGQELEFQYAHPLRVVVSLKERERWQEDYRRGNAICTALAVRDMEPGINSELHNVIDGDSVKIFNISPGVRKITDDLFIQLRTLSQSTITTFNWTYGLDSPPAPCPSVRSHAWYSEDGEKWLQYSEVRSVRLLVEESTHSIFASSVKTDEVVRKVEAGAEIPLSRQLFYEAWSQVGTNPRSALVIGVAAAEVGLKRLIATLVPGTDWLMEEIQTPPVGKILRHFLPTLPIRAKRTDGGPILPPTKLIRQIEKAVGYRNKVVHVGAPPPSRQELALTLRAISDLLWLCDVYMGEHWAMKHVSLETKKNWEAKGS
jgi:hypothetical protein